MKVLAINGSSRRNSNKMRKQVTFLLLGIVLMLFLVACRTSEPEEQPVSLSEREEEQQQEKVTNEEDQGVGIFDLDKKSVLLNSGYEMPVMGLGTYSLDHDTCVNSVKALLQNGGRLIDTAYMYGNEDAVGEGVRQAMEEYGISREEIFVITKIYPSQFSNPEAAINMALEKLDIPMDTTK